MLLAIVLIFSVGYLNSFAYASPFEDCNVKDCGAAILGQLRPNTSSCVINFTVKYYYNYCPSCYFSELIDTKVEYCHLVRGASADESHEEIYCSE